MSNATQTNGGNKPLSFAALNLFCEQIALVLGAGISVYEGVCMMHDEAATRAEQRLYDSISGAMDEGLSFPEALSKSGAFPPYMVQMVVIGEVSGRLDTVLNQLARYYKREQSMQDAVRYAVSYPAMMVAMMGIVIGVLVAKVLPIFNEVFIDLGSELTGFSKNVMQLGLAFSGVLPFLAVLLTALFLLGMFAVRTGTGKRYWRRFLQQNLLTKGLAYRIAVSRFAAGMSLMLASGLDTEDSIALVVPLVNHPVVRDKIEDIRQEIAEGEPFAGAMSDHAIFSATYHCMLAIGERTGNIDEVMENISQRYEVEIETSLSALIATIEPSLVAVLSVVVGAILLAVMLPLMSILSVM